jgi:hypothetical protein
MQKVFLSSFILFSLVVFSLELSAQNSGATIIRPAKVDAKIEGTSIAEPGDYAINIGDLVDLGYTYPVVPAAIPKKLSFKLSEDGILQPCDPTVFDVVTPELVGSGSKTFCYKAVDSGRVSLTLTIDENSYDYSFDVQARQGKSALCVGIFTAVQFEGTVFIFGNGVHPTSGYRTYFKKSAITIWPPQHSLMCEKPDGASPQVLTPFLVCTSFKAEEKVEFVIVHDKNGKHRVNVTQL